MVEGVEPVLECVEENEYGCIRWQTVTPATAVKEQLNTAVTSPIRQLELADQTAEMLLPIFNTMLQNLLNAGIQKIFKSDNGTESIVELPTNSQTTITTNTSVSLASAEGYLSARKTSIDHLNSIIPTLDQTATCYQALSSQSSSGIPIPVQNPVQADVNGRAEYSALLTSYTREVTTLEPLIARLEDIDASARQTTSQSGIISLSTEYRQVAGSLPTTAERTSAIQQRNFLAQKKTTIANTLTSCQSQQNTTTTSIF